MTDISSSSMLFEAALHDYEKQTGMKLIDHPLARQLETCSSVDSITAVIQEQARAFTEFRRDNGKVMKPLKRVVDVLHALSTSTILSEGISLVRRIALVGIYFSRRCFYSHSPLRRQYPQLLLFFSAYDFLGFYAAIILTFKFIRRSRMSARAMMRSSTSSSPLNAS